MPNLKILCASIAILTTATTSAHCEITLGFYQQIKDISKISGMKDYIVGIGRGTFWSNAVLENQGQKRLFCMPAHLQLDEGIILSLLNQEIRSPTKGTPYDKEAPIEMIMVIAFKSRFPC